MPHMWGWASKGSKFRQTASGTKVALLLWVVHPGQHRHQPDGSWMLQTRSGQDRVLFRLSFFMNDWPHTMISSGVHWFLSQCLTTLCPCFLFWMVKEWIQQAMEKVTLRSRRRQWVYSFWPQRNLALPQDLLHVRFVTSTNWQGVPRQDTKFWFQPCPAGLFPDLQCFSNQVVVWSWPSSSLWCDSLFAVFWDC